MRGLILLACPIVLGCASTSRDFIDAQGNFADGTPFSVHLFAVSGIETSLQPALGQVEALTGATVSGPEDLRSFRLEWLTLDVHEGGSYASAPSGPVVFYVERPRPDGGALDLEASVVNGGTITFTQNRRLATGTLANLVLARGGSTIITVVTGSFQATNP
jgi:hypothetical protein